MNAAAWSFAADRSVVAEDENTDLSNAVVVADVDIVRRFRASLSWAWRGRHARACSS